MRNEHGPEWWRVTTRRDKYGNITDKWLNGYMCSNSKPSDEHVLVESSGVTHDTTYHTQREAKALVRSWR
jgi:hypothetical protein